MQRRGRFDDRGQLDEPHAVGELAGHGGGEFDRQAGLAPAAGTDQGDEPTGRQLAGQSLHLVATTHDLVGGEGRLPTSCVAAARGGKASGRSRATSWYTDSGRDNPRSRYSPRRLKPASPG